MSRRTIFPYVGVSMPSSYATGISLTMDENYILTAQLTDQNGNPIGEEQTIDLPLESVVVGGSYDSQTQSLILTLDNGNTISIPVSDLISGLQPTIDANNKLNADYIADGTTNKVFTATEQTKLANIESGAEVNVQADWNESDNTSDSYIQNKPTLGTMASESASDYTPTASLATVATSGSYSDLSNTPTIPTVNDGSITITQGGVNRGTFSVNQNNSQVIDLDVANFWGGTQIEFDNLTDLNSETTYLISDKLDYYEDIINKPNLNIYSTKAENAQQDYLIQTKMTGHFMTQQEFDNLGQNLPEGDNYFIEGTTVEMVVTFTDQTTATYNIVVD